MKGIDSATPGEWDAASKAVMGRPDGIPLVYGQPMQVPIGSIPFAGKIMPEGAVGDINSTAKGSGARFNAGKPQLDLIPLRIIAASYKGADPWEGRIGGNAGRCLEFLGSWQETGEEKYLYAALRSLGALDAVWTSCAKVLKYGLGKYAPWNWAKGMAWSIPLACAARHCEKLLNDEQLDAESGEDHEGHIAANIVMLLTFIRTFPEGNDRPTILA